MHSGPEDGTQLCLEDLGIIQAEADSSAAQERVFLMTEIEALGRLVPSDVERADDDSMRGDPLGHMTVHGVLLLLIGRYRSVEIEELGSVEADAISSGGRNLVKFLWKLNVGGEGDMAPVERGGVAFSE